LWGWEIFRADSNELLGLLLLEQEFDDCGTHPGCKVGLERESLLQSLVQFIRTLWGPELKGSGILAVGGGTGDEE
jgi:hypothetical protein